MLPVSTGPLSCPDIRGPRSVRTLREHSMTGVEGCLRIWPSTILTTAGSSHPWKHRSAKVGVSPSFLSLGSGPGLLRTSWLNLVLSCCQGTWLKSRS